MNDSVKVLASVAAEGHLQVTFQVDGSVDASVLGVLSGRVRHLEYTNPLDQGGKTAITIVVPFSIGGTLPASPMEEDDDG